MKWLILNFKEFLSFNLLKENVLDTTGAGDAFCGGFISHLLLNPRRPGQTFSDDVINDAIEKGHWAAREIIQRQGCSFPQRCNFFQWKKGIEQDCPRANAWILLKLFIFSMAKLFLPCSNVNEIISFLELKADQKVQTNWK